MEIKKSNLKLVKEALEYAVANCRSESKDAEFMLLYVDVVGAIEREKQQDEYVESVKSLPGCVFHYCGYRPKCEGEKCPHSKQD